MAIDSATPHITKDADPKILYFAYGSNLAWAQMKERCPGAEAAGLAQLKDYKLAFTRKSASRQCGVADVVPEIGQKVWGVIYSLSNDDLRRLDRSEGYYGLNKNNSYERKTLVVHCACCGKNEVPVQIYLAVRQENPPPPNGKYIRLIIDGARHWRLPESYIKGLEARAGIISLISRPDITPLVRQILACVTGATMEISRIVSGLGELDAFLKLRFDKGFEGLPGSCGKTNFQEVLNQASTSLVALAGCEWLFKEFPQVEFLSLAWQEGTGLDIESSKHGIAAECYAATTRHSNNKFEDDLKRLEKQAEYTHRYLFFYSHAQEKDLPTRTGIKIIRISLRDFATKHLEAAEQLSTPELRP